MVKNPPANVGDASDPWSGKIPQAMEQPSLSPTATAHVLQLLKPAHSEPVLHKRSHTMRSPHTTPHSPQEAPAAIKTQHSQKQVIFFLLHEKNQSFIRDVGRQIPSSARHSV